MKKMYLISLLTIVSFNFILSGCTDNSISIENNSAKIDGKEITISNVKKNGETLNVKFKIDYKETPSGFNKEFKLGEGNHYFADSEEEIVKSYNTSTNDAEIKIHSSKENIKKSNSIVIVDDQFNIIHTFKFK